MGVSDVMHDALSRLDRHSIDADPDPEARIVMTFMKALRYVGDLAPGAWGDPRRAQLIAKILEAAPIADDLRALQVAFEADAGHARFFNEPMPPGARPQ